MKIPKIIHQTWKNEDVPENFRQMSISWKEKHPDWQYILWTDDMNRAFIREQFPDFLGRYDSYANNIQRVDAVRYFLLYTYGGIYVDLDFECRSDITPLILDAQCVFGREPDAHCSVHSKEMIISNAFMASVSRHPFMAQLCAELVNDLPFIDHLNDRILETTGPFMLSRVYNSYERKEELQILNADLIYPLTKEELLKLAKGEDPEGRHRDKLNKAYAVHHYAGTWWKKERYQI